MVAFFGASAQKASKKPSLALEIAASKSRPAASPAYRNQAIPGSSFSPTQSRQQRRRRSWKQTNDTKFNVLSGEQMRLLLSREIGNRD
jgi:hypothetical protein